MKIIAKHKSYFQKKVIGALKRRPHLFKSFLSNGGFPIMVDGEPSMAIQYDVHRYERAITCIAKALHFHHYHSKWNDELWILPVSARFSPQHPKYEIQNARLDILKSGEFDTPKYGENQDVFCCQFLPDEDDTSKRLRMVFYSGFVTYAVSLNIVNSNAKQNK